MSRSEDVLRDAVREAAALLEAVTHSSPYTVFEDVDPSESVTTGEGRQALGFIEGAALALNMTPIELLDECDVDRDD